MRWSGRRLQRPNVRYRGRHGRRSQRPRPCGRAGIRGWSNQRWSNQRDSGTNYYKRNSRAPQFSEMCGTNSPRPHFKRPRPLRSRTNPCDDSGSDARPARRVLLRTVVHTQGRVRPRSKPALGALCCRRARGRCATPRRRSSSISPLALRLLAPLPLAAKSAPGPS